jgi:plastocyanin
MGKPILLLAAGVTAAALAIPSAGNASAEETVKVKDFAFSPASLTVRHGTKVTWKFQDSTKHNVTVKKGPAKFHSSDIRRGKYSHKLTKPGTYKLICSIHPDMHQTIVVS